MRFETLSCDFCCLFCLLHLFNARQNVFFIMEANTMNLDQSVPVFEARQQLLWCLVGVGGMKKGVDNSFVCLLFRLGVVQWFATC